MTVGLLFGYFILAFIVIALSLGLYVGFIWVMQRLGLRAPDYPPDWKR